ncbi:MAG TPA: hypothetical protein PK735_11765, partial [Flavobacteriales bacterium]|nr:hypothetical protein [Flavobacteriales bacterium]
MSWKIAIVVALLTAFITAITSIIVTNYVADKCGVSDQDGGRSMGIFFFLGPGAFVMGLLFGLLVSYLMHAVEWA